MDTQIATRSVQRVVTGMPTSDGAGVRLTRVIGQPQLPDLDPFLMLDEFGTDKPEDYIAGFPDHPHRGFETVTYMLDGRMRHRDNHGNEGVLVPGSVQWMTAGRGLVHSEMPEQQAGRMRGFQLWLNLPARDKMTAPRYQEFGPERIPTAIPACSRPRIPRTWISRCARARSSCSRYRRTTRRSCMCSKARCASERTRAPRPCARTSSRCWARAKRSGSRV